jgi:L-asparaginase
MSRLVALLRGIAVALVTVLAAASPIEAQLPFANDTAPREAKVLVLTTGGTIASRAGAPQTSGDSLVAAVPELLQHAAIEVEEFSRVGSSQLTPAHWLGLAKRVNDRFAADPDLAGIVITHGTDTMDETGFFLNLTVRDVRPVVLVGSMRTSTEISADGPANLLNAVRIAVSPHALGMGVMLALNEDIASARDVWKTHNRRVETFRSPELGFLGFADPDTVIFYRAPLKPHTLASEFYIGAMEELPRVDIVPDYTGFEARVLEDAVDRNPDGIVLATFAGGRMSAGAREGVAGAVRDETPIVLASRVPGGRIVGDVTGDSGALVARDLPPYKARILLMLALTITADPIEIQRILDTY